MVAATDPSSDCGPSAAALKRGASHVTKPTGKETPPPSSTAADGMQDIGARYQRQGFSQQAADLILASWFAPQPVYNEPSVATTKAHHCHSMATVVGGQGNRSNNSHFLGHVLVLLLFCLLSCVCLERVKEEKES